MRPIAEIILAARAETDVGLVSTLCDELCDAAEQTDRWLVDAHVRHAREQDEASAQRAVLVANNESLMALFAKRDEADFAADAANASFRSLWDAFGETTKQRDHAVATLKEIATKSTDTSARTLANHALKIADPEES